MCPDGELSPLSYGTRARIVMQHSEELAEHNDLKAMPATQFLFRGEENVEGRAQLKVKSFGGDHQYIYAQNYNVNWTELQVCIGIPRYETGEIGLFRTASCLDGSSRRIRLRPTEPGRNIAGLDWAKYKGPRVRLRRTRL